MLCLPYTHILQKLLQLVGFSTLTGSQQIDHHVVGVCSAIFAFFVDQF